jgi:hypothetical protein
MPSDPINCTPKPTVKTGPKASAVPSNHAVIGPWPMAGVGPTPKKLLPHVLLEDGCKVMLMLLDAAGRVPPPSRTYTHTQLRQAHCGTSPLPYPSV